MRTTASPRCRTVVADAVHLKKEPLLIERASRLGVIGRSHCWDTPERVSTQ
jgi:hypothetical protein